MTLGHRWTYEGKSNKNKNRKMRDMTFENYSLRHLFANGHFPSKEKANIIKLIGEGLCFHPRYILVVSICISEGGEKTTNALFYM